MCSESLMRGGFLQLTVAGEGEWEKREWEKRGWEKREGCTTNCTILEGCYAAENPLGLAKVQTYWLNGARRPDGFIRACNLSCTH